MSCGKVCVIGAGSSGIAAAKTLHERGFEFDGEWYADTADIALCSLDDGNLGTDAVGVREGTGEHATAAWLFAGLPLPGSYTTSPSDGVGATEGALVITDSRDDSRWLTDGLTGSITVYAPGAGAIDVVWHDVSLTTASGDLGVTTKGWTSCTLPPL